MLSPTEPPRCIPIGEMPDPGPMRPSAVGQRRGPAVDESVVRELVGALQDASRAEPVATFPRAPAAAALPGLYSWWCAETGRRMLSATLGLPLPPLIYAGLAGATKWPSGRVGTATLVSHIRQMHLGSKIDFSTFRWTLACLLLDQLALRHVGPRRLAPESEQRLTQWMGEHPAGPCGALPGPRHPRRGGGRRPGHARPAAEPQRYAAQSDPRPPVRAPCRADPSTCIAQQHRSAEWNTRRGALWQPQGVGCRPVAWARGGLRRLHVTVLQEERLCRAGR